MTVVDGLAGLAVAAGALAISWLVIVVLAARLPPGLLKDLARSCPHA